MQTRNIKYLLLISLAFNLAFLGGFAYRFFFAPFPRAAIHPHEMRPPARQFFYEKRDELQVCGREFTESKKDFLKSLVAPDFQEEKALEMMRISVEKHMEMETEIGKSMIELRKKMSAEEAKRIFGQMQMHERRFERHPGRKIKNKF
ncbi:MAG: hypothetical protein K9N09_02915 [Candidatus Cloacimonetes bacterium]|nr:hypothetical protein [Candidatus Cloacimonadota bacterium]MCF7813179.1 hypothetical protein [Candidatus Cloacimonadota bacterium]MCF7867627.1 hypothetical protein [Candidatus Cloacimonadota bacterium]MCF7883098.1 hypothetical protein [Candidatus Cloacimonadota bacterium]